MQEKETGIGFRKKSGWGRTQCARERYRDRIKEKEERNEKKDYEDKDQRQRKREVRTGMKGIERKE